MADSSVTASGSLTVSGTITVVVRTSPLASHAILFVKGSAMPGQITVDTTNETATVQFLDDHGDVATPPTGAVVTFTSSDPAVLTIATDPTNPFQGDVTPVAEGTSDVGATIADAAGNPILEPDGVTPFAVTAQTVTVSAGEAATAELTLSV
jgi:hypothetical protein